MNLVAERILSAQRERAIIGLLDDDSPVVQAAIRDELKRLEGLGVEFLKKLGRSGNRILASHARDYLEEIEGPDTIKRFVQFIRSLNYELETGCLLLDRTVYPDIDRSECCMTLDAIAARCRELMVLPSSPWEKCKVLNRVIFHEWDFRGNTENYYDPLNSFLSQLLKRRKGIPITLSILYILVGQRCELVLEPVAMPRHFMVGCFLEKTPFYIDAFARGGFRTADELKEVLSKNNIKPRTCHLAPTPVGEVLCRCCMNLNHQYTLSSDLSHARLFEGFVDQFDRNYQRHANP